MSSNYQEITKGINEKLKDFSTNMPDTMAGFTQLAKACHGDDALTSKTKELMATAIAVSARCQGCLGFHAKACVRMAVTRKEFEEMLQVAIYMGGGPAVMTAAEAMQAFEEFGGAKAG